ncbi:MAG: hypothetical protein IPP37_17330 [Saprospiraceae bacterium]|nr:hypothetical protein [Saprospiraceae bacterium]
MTVVDPSMNLYNCGFGIHSINRKLQILYGHDYELQFINGPQNMYFTTPPQNGVRVTALIVQKMKHL